MCALIDFKNDANSTISNRENYLRSPDCSLAPDMKLNFAIALFVAKNVNEVMMYPS